MEKKIIPIVVMSVLLCAGLSICLISCDEKRPVENDFSDTLDAVYSGDSSEDRDVHSTNFALENLMAILLEKTDMTPVEHFYGAFAEEGTFGVVAIYQYDSEWMEKDNCQVWYTDGTTTKQLFVWE